MKIERFEDIEAWQLARKLTQKVYRMTRKPRFARDYGLKGAEPEGGRVKMRRAGGATSIFKEARWRAKYEERKSFNREPVRGDPGPRSPIAAAIL